MYQESIPSSKYTHLTTYQAGVLQALVYRSLQKKSDILLGPYGINKTQWLIIGTVLDHGAPGIRLSDIASTLNTTMSYLTNAITLLESKNILVRSSSVKDSRAKYVTVSPLFQYKCNEIEHALRQGLRNIIYSEISADDFRIYMKVLYTLSEISA
ncbi:MAG: hypothetical protein NVS1B7_0720 [Candidatus Saccharimonadales bacterium]